MFHDAVALAALTVLGAVSALLFIVPRLRRSERALTGGAKAAVPGCFGSLLLYGLFITLVASPRINAVLLVCLPLLLGLGVIIVLPNLTDAVQTRLGLRTTAAQQFAAMLLYCGLLILFTLAVIVHGWFAYGWLGYGC